MSLAEDYPPLELIYGSTTNHVLAWCEMNQHGQEVVLGALMDKRSLFSKDYCTSIRNARKQLFDYFMSTYRDLEDAVKELKTTKKNLQKAQQEIEELKKKSYADIAAAAAAAATVVPAAQQPKDNKQKQRNPNCVVNVYPKEDPRTGLLSTASSDATKIALGTKIVGTGVGVTALWKTSKHGVTVCCRTQNEAEKLASVVNQQMAKDFVATKKQPKNPSVTILLTEGRYADKELYPGLLKDILEKNDFFENSENNPLKIVHGYRTRQGNAIVVLEMGAKNFHGLKQAGNKIFAALDYCRARERDPVVRCFGCQRYGHKRGKCVYAINGKKAMRCARCGGNHDVGFGDTVCKEEPKCVNCADQNRFAGSNNPIGHESRDPKCPMHARAERRAKNEINYSF